MSQRFRSYGCLTFFGDYGESLWLLVLTAE